jgi:uncharacterized protein (DUF849 family)
MSRTVIITCALTGSIHTPTMSPHLPVQPEEIALQAIEAARAGASILHLHARDPESGQPSGDPALMARIVEPIRSSCDAVINISTGGSSRMGLEERLAPAKAAAPEMCSLNMGSMNFGIFPLAERHQDWVHAWEPGFLEATRDVVFRNTFKDIETIVGTLGKRFGTRFELECYDVGHIQTVAYYLKRGVLRAPVFLQFVMGVLGGIDADAEQLMHMKRTADRLLGSDYAFSVLAAGRQQMPLGTMGVILGGHVRVGLEDSLTLGRRLAVSNAEQVAHIRGIVQALGHEVATPSQARAMLGIGGAAAVADGARS